MPGSHFEHELPQLFDVRAVGHAEGNAKAHTRIGVTPVGDAVGDEIGIGHDDGNVVVGDDRGAAQADLANLPSHAADFDPVADGDGPFGENDKATDKVADDVLQSESQADAHRAGQNSQRTEIYAHGLEADIEAEREHEITENAGQRELQSGIQMRPPQNPHQEVPPDQPFAEDNQDYQDNQHEQAGNSNSAAWQQRIIEDALQRRREVMEQVRHSAGILAQP